jgi:hypothetical protein
MGKLDSGTGFQVILLTGLVGLIWPLLSRFWLSGVYLLLTTDDGREWFLLKSVGIDEAQRRLRLTRFPRD